jgi:maltooligosyltrehalose trehalohydrolase
MTDRFIHPLPFGATRLDNGSTRFRLWAPNRRETRLLINDAPPRSMEARPDGWFELTADCRVGDLYRFQFEDELKVPDPASRYQHGDVHGCSVILDPLAYQWKHPDWAGRPWEETILYELHVGACGGYRGVAERLPALKALGITAIELMPINEFPGDRNWGYDGVLPFAPEAGYGTPEELMSSTTISDPTAPIYIPMPRRSSGTTFIRPGARPSTSAVRKSATTSRTMHSTG